MTARIGVISDTHGLLRPEALRALAGVDLILHAGDVGDSAVLEALRRVAPTHAVRGNTDSHSLGLPETDVVEAGGRSIYLIHDIGRLDLDPGAAGLAAVVFGHSHEPYLRRESSVDGGAGGAAKSVLFFNPGSAGPRRFSLPVTVGRLRLDDGELQGEIIELDV